MADQINNPEAQKASLASALRQAGARSLTGGNGSEIIETPARASMLESLERMRAESDDRWARFITGVRAFVDDGDNQQHRIKRWFGA